MRCILIEQRVSHVRHLDARPNGDGNSALPGVLIDYLLDPLDLVVSYARDERANTLAQEASGGGQLGERDAALRKRVAQPLSVGILDDDDQKLHAGMVLHRKTPGLNRGWPFDLTELELNAAPANLRGSSCVGLWVFFVQLSKNAEQIGLDVLDRLHEVFVRNPGRQPMRAPNV